MTFTPFEPGVSYSGHFTSWFGGALNQRNHVEHDTNTFVLTGTDGSRVVIHMTSHVSTNANGVPTVEFERESIHCIRGPAAGRLQAGSARFPPQAAAPRKCRFNW